MDFTLFLQQLINGLALGSIYALIALGYTMVYGVLRFINFAHGDIYMLGAFFGFALAPFLTKFLPEGSGIYGAVAVLLAAMALCAAMGVLIEKLAYRPLRNRPRLTVLITAIGVSLFIQNMTLYFFGADPKGFPELVPIRAIEGLGDLTVLTSQAAIVGVTIVLLFVLSFVVMKTKLGTAMRALSLNPVACSLMGVNNDRVISFTFAIGSSLAAAAGILISFDSPSIDPMMGNIPGIKAFVAAVLGGIGNIPGAALGGLILGITETMVVGYINPNYRDAIAFGILILILLCRPNGLLGKVEREKV